MQRNRARQSEVAVDKRVDAPAAALDVEMRGVAHDRAGEFLVPSVRHLPLRDRDTVLNVNTRSV